jgi:hypothetical protein
MPLNIESVVLELDARHQLYIVRHDGDDTVYLSLLEGAHDAVQTRVRVSLDLEQAQRVAKALIGLASIDDWRAGEP